MARSDGYEIWKNAVENHKAQWSEDGFAAVRFDHAPQPSAGSSGIFSSHMKITLAHVGGRTGSKDGFDAAVEEYLGRCSGFARCETVGFRSEAALLQALARQRGRAPASVVLLDGQGRQMTSEAFAAWLGARREEGTQELVFAIGPADGWSAEARTRAGMVLSLGTMTMAHRLARLVMAEQIYRAVTILTGHPYHMGH